jgi:hypothetical protein
MSKKKKEYNPEKLKIYFFYDWQDEGWRTNIDDEFFVDYTPEGCQSCLHTVFHSMQEFWDWYWTGTHCNHHGENNTPFKYGEKCKYNK